MPPMSKTQPGLRAELFSGMESKLRPMPSIRLDEALSIFRENMSAAQLEKHQRVVMYNMLI